MGNSESWQNGDYQRIEAAIRFIEENTQAQPGLEEIAEHLNLSKFHFQRMFTRWAGISPNRFLRYLTLSNAKTLLRESSSILDVALDAGLSGPSRLHDLFVDLEAVTPGEFRSGGRGVEIRYGFHPGPFGKMFLAASERGLCGLAFLSPATETDTLAEFRARWPNAEIRLAQKETARIAAKLFGTGGSSIEKITLHAMGTNFQVRVWEALLKIPAGTTCTYQDIAETIGSPKAHRAVGSAIGHNPVGWLIPCHRVIRKNGAFGEYHWGATRKRALLAWEAARQEIRQ